MARILIMPNDDAAALLNGWGDAVSGTTVEVVAVDDMESAWRLACHGGGSCPIDVRPGQTWGTRGEAMDAGERHLLNHLVER